MMHLSCGCCGEESGGLMANKVYLFVKKRILIDSLMRDVFTNEHLL